MPSQHTQTAVVIPSLLFCRFYAIIVIRITDSFNRDSPPDVGDYLDAMPYNSDAEPPQQFYITAAWEDPTEVPRTFTIGDGTITKARDTTYENVGLSSDTDYAYIVRFDIMSNTNEVSLHLNSDKLKSDTVRL